MGCLVIILLLAAGAQCLPFPGTPAEDAAAEKLQNETRQNILNGGQPDDIEEEEEECVGSGVKTDHLARRHTWKFLFDQAFTVLHAEGPSFIEAAKEVFEKTSGRLGYIYNKGSGFLDSLKVYLSRSVGFIHQPKSSELASNAGRDLYVQAISNLRGHVFQRLTTQLIREATNSLGSNHGNLGRGIALLGLSSSALVIWLVASWCVNKCQERRKTKKDKRQRRQQEAGASLLRDYEAERSQHAPISSAQFSALNFRPNELSSSRVRGSQQGHNMIEMAPRMS